MSTNKKQSIEIGLIPMHDFIFQGLSQGETFMLNIDYAKRVQDMLESRKYEISDIIRELDVRVHINKINHNTDLVLHVPIRKKQFKDKNYLAVIKKILDDKFRVGNNIYFYHLMKCSDTNNKFNMFFILQSK